MATPENPNGTTEDKDEWVCCDACGIWRSLPAHHVFLDVNGTVFDPAGGDEVKWTCSDGVRSEVGGIGGWACGDSESRLMFGSQTRRRRVKKIALGDRSMLIKNLRDGTYDIPMGTFSHLTSEQFGDGSLIFDGGFDAPFIVDDTPEGLKVPKEDFTIADVAHIVGKHFPVNVMDVTSQSETEGWTLGQWAEYFVTHELPETVSKMKSSSPLRSSPKKDHVPESRIPLNLISLEFSATKLASMVSAPDVIRSHDLIHTAWPQHLRPSSSTSPSVSNYCLSSMAGSYTDFHTDFGGSSVWYHLHTGAKTFYLIPPTPSNLSVYERWVCDPHQHETFFPTLLPREQVSQVTLQEGQTLFIPSGWIHSVYTPRPSLVFGGNFLTLQSIPKMLAVHGIEVRTKVAEMYRFPYFVQIMFYAAAEAVQRMRGKGRPLSDVEKSALESLPVAIKAWDSTAGGSGGFTPMSIEACAVDAAKKCGLSTVQELVSELEGRLRDGDKWNPPARPKPVLKLTLKKKAPSVAPYQSNITKAPRQQVYYKGEDPSLKINLARAAPKSTTQAVFYKGENPSLKINLARAGGGTGGTSVTISKTPTIFKDDDDEYVDDNEEAYIDDDDEEFQPEYSVVKKQPSNTRKRRYEDEYEDDWTPGDEDYGRKKKKRTPTKNTVEEPRKNLIIHPESAKKSLPTNFAKRKPQQSNSAANARAKLFKKLAR